MIQAGLSLLYLAAGLVGLIAAAETFVRGAVSIAHRFKVSDIVIGSTIVAIGTSAPELVINVAATLEGKGSLVVSNIVGSNIVNICLGLGIASQLAPIAFNRKALRVDIPLGLIGALLLFVGFLPGGQFLVLPRIVGAVLLLVFILYMMYSKGEAAESSSQESMRLPRSITYLLIGGIGLAFCGDLVMNSAVNISKWLEIPEAIVGATVVAAGGSLPEVFACVAAAKLGRPTIALGNVAGSQVFNLFGVLGLSTVIRQVAFQRSLVVDICVLIGLTLLVLAMFFGKKAAISSSRGKLLVALYVGYLTYLGLQAMQG